MKPKRKFVYILKPIHYEIAPCPRCGNSDTEYSEWAHLMWCDVCKKEYRPKHHGIFDGPIPVGISSILGISFDRMEIETGRIIKRDTPEWNEAWP